MNIFMNEGYATELTGITDAQGMVDAFGRLFDEVSAE